MRLETTDSSLDANQLVSKHHRATHKFGCQEIVKLMKEHQITLEHLAAHLELPTKKQALDELKTKLFRPQESRMEEIQELEQSEENGERQGQPEVSTASTTPTKAPAKTSTQSKTATAKTFVKK